jgi:hypothetical protein
MPSVDPHSQTWAAVRAYCEHEIDRARDRLERKAVDASETEYDRGYIRALRSLLSELPPSEGPAPAKVPPLSDT